MTNDRKKAKATKLLTKSSTTDQDFKHVFKSTFRGLVEEMEPIKPENIKEGARVYVLWEDKKFYGTLHKNVQHPNVSEWYISYHDGQDCAVMDMSQVFQDPQPFAFTAI